MSPTPRASHLEDQEDNWDRAVKGGGCTVENQALLDCKTTHGDWRKCTAEMMAFKKCWDKRQQGKDEQA